MLKVRLHKSCHDYFKDGQIKTIRDVINWSIDYHNLRDKSHSVDFFFVDNITTHLKTDQTTTAYGQFRIESLKNSQIIVMSDRSMFGILSTIFHEMTHLKHLLHHDICYTIYGKTWRGDKYPLVDKTKFSEYQNLPDECDARHHQRRMMTRWIISWTAHKIFFWRK